jgi:hypothetical protein
MIDLRPRSATELVDAAFQVLRQAPLQFIVAGAVVYVPWLVIQLVFHLQLVPSATPDLTVLGANLVAGILVYVILGGAVAVLARDVYLERTPDVGAAYRAVGKRVVPLLVASLSVLLILAVAAILLMLPVGIAAAMLGASSIPITVGIMVVFFFVAVFYPLARFFCVRQAVMLEGLGAWRALGRSSELSSGGKKHILGTLVLAGLLTIVVSAGVTIAASAVGSTIILRVAETLIGVCVRPFFSIVETVLYYDVRIRKEAFDIEFMAGGDSAAAPSTNVAI